MTLSKVTSQLGDQKVTYLESHGWQYCNYIVYIPSWERSHIPLKLTFESMIFRTSQGEMGICDRSLQGFFDFLASENSGEATVMVREVCDFLLTGDLGPTLLRHGWGQMWTRGTGLVFFF